MTHSVIRQGFRFRLRNDAKAEAVLRRWDGCCRKVWNLGLAEQQRRHEAGLKYAGYVEMASWLTAWKRQPELAYLAEPPVHVLQNTLRALDRTFRRFFEKTGGYPKFKRYGQACGLVESDVACFDLDEVNGRVRVPKLGWLRYRKSRVIEGVPKTMTLRREIDGWHVSVQTERTGQVACSATAMGAADRGITNFLATADGKLVAPLNAHRESLHRLRRYQRAVSRRMEAAKVAAGLPKDKPFPKWFRFTPSNRLRKAQARVARIHHKIACQRADFLHKLSTEIADTHAAFCIEDLKVAGMSASAKGHAEVPGRNVRQKAGLNRSILDQGWSMFENQLHYKLVWRGGQLVKVPAAYTSQACSACGHVHPDNRDGECFKCRACGHEDHADINAAKNILAAGHAVLAGNGHALVEDAVQSGRPVKREPTREWRHAA